MRIVGAALVTAVLLASTACGSTSDANRPSIDQVSQALRAKGDGSLVPTSVTLTKKAADCVAQGLVYSKLSDRALKALVDQDKNFAPSAADKSVLKSLDQRLISCVTGP